MSLIPTSVVDIEPGNFRQVVEEKQQLISARPISSTFQQTGGICNIANGNFTGRCRRRHKEVYEVVVLVKFGIWIKDKAFNGILTLVDDQRGRIKIPGAIWVKKEVTQPNWNIVPQDISVFHPSMDTNQIWAFIYKPPQALSIRGITDVSYLPEGSGDVSFHLKCKMY